MSEFTENQIQPSCSKWTKRRRINKNVEEHMKLADEGTLCRSRSRCSRPTERTEITGIKTVTARHRSRSCSINAIVVDLDTRPPGSYSNSSGLSFESNFHQDLDLDENDVQSLSSGSRSTSSSDTEFTEEGSFLQSQSCRSSLDEDGLDDLNFKLAKWASSFSVSMVAVASLLSLLQPFHPSLPKDPRTLLKTPRNVANEVKKITDGSYFHFGVVESVLKVMKKCSHLLEGVKDVYMQVNIDGLPLFKSSNTQFWPILGKICLPFETDPFIIGLFSGEKKPGNVDEYLHDFVQEMQTLEHQPVTLEKHSFCINLFCFVCDAPARAYLKQVKGHTGYYGCEKCTQKGSWQGKMTFPIINAPKRMDNNLGANHQISVSPLRALSIGMVTHFPYDYMHMVCLGVMRRFLWYWVRSPVSKGFRLGTHAIHQISAKLLSFKENIPREFSRKCRPLSEMDRWKATEFRQFLLYTGIVSLKGQLPLELYNHFLLLFVAIFCLASPEFCSDHADYAHNLLCLFVSDCERLYEKELVVYNVHGLTHLADDVKKYGSLDSYSAFPFETFLGQLKRLVHKPQSTLQQVIKRLIEKRQLDISIKRQKTTVAFGTTEKKHFAGPLPQFCEEFNQFQQIRCKQYFLSLSKGNNCVEVNGIFFLIRNILSKEDSDEVILAVERFSRVCDYFSYPLNSSYLGIFLATNLTGNLETVSLLHVTKKMVALPHDDSFVLIPFCHKIN